MKFWGDKVAILFLVYLHEIWRVFRKLSLSKGL